MSRPSDEKLFERCLDALVDLPGGARVGLGAVDAVLDPYLDAIGGSALERADALYRLIAAFIVRAPATRFKELVIEQMTARRRATLSVVPVPDTPAPDDPFERLARRLKASRKRGAFLSPAEVELVLDLVSPQPNLGS